MRRVLPEERVQPLPVCGRNLLELEIKTSQVTTIRRADYLPSCFMRQRIAQTVTPLPTKSDNQSAIGVCMNSTKSSNIHKPRKTNTPARTRANSAIRTSFLFLAMLLSGMKSVARATQN